MLTVLCSDPVSGEQRKDDLGICICLEDGALVLELVSDLVGVHDDRIRCKRDASDSGLDGDGLDRFRSVLTGRTALAVCDRTCALQCRQCNFIKDIGNQTHSLVNEESTVIVYCDTCTFLSSVLQGENAVISIFCDVIRLTFDVIRSENSAHILPSFVKK